MKKFLTENKRFYLFLLGITLYFGLVFIWPDFYKTSYKNYKDLTLLFLQWSTVLFAVFGLLYLLSIHKIVFGICFPVLIFFTSILAYYRFTLNATLTPNLIDIALHNDLKTSLDLISVYLILFVFFNIILALSLVYYRRRKLQCKTILIHLLLATLIIVSTVVGNSRLKAPIINRIPYVLLFSVKDYLANNKVIEKQRPDMTKGTSTTTDSLLVVYIQGESLRADHLSLNGYERETTPNLRMDSVISFSKIYSPYTNTDESIPYILTDADSIHPEKRYTNRSFISFYKKAGYFTSWIANQVPTEAYIYFAKESNQLIYANLGKTVYNFEPYTWLDEALTKDFDKTLQRPQPLKLVILHTIGSHWWYKSHYTKSSEKFLPVIASRIVSSNTTPEMINTYDNTVLYTDYFLHTIIQRLKDKKAIMIYLSDHGEALGEENHWLHANEAAPIHYPACIIWLSDKYKKAYPEAEPNLNLNKDLYFNTSFLFHSILDAGNIQTPLLNPVYSIFRKHL